MLVPEMKIEPMLVDVSSDDSVGGEEDVEIDSLWLEVGELLSNEPLLEFVDIPESVLVTAPMEKPNVKEFRGKTGEGF